MQLLIGHTSPETAYVVEDYPYGFRLRCSIRYWIEYRKNVGFRFVSQTTNPKKLGVYWNKPKASTYCRFGGAMYLDDVGHVKFAGLTEYSDTQEAIAFRETYGKAVPLEGDRVLNWWIHAKISYDTKKAEQV